MSEKILIIGAGAAGLMAAGTISGRGKDVAILERNDKPARKVAITGKGRCNVTNNCKELSELIANVPTNGRFLYSAFSNFMPQDTIDLIEDMGVPLKCERGNRVFPCSDKATDIVDALVHYGTDDGAQIIHGRAKEMQEIKEDLIDKLSDCSLFCVEEPEGTSIVMGTVWAGEFSGGSEKWFAYVY